MNTCKTCRYWVNQRCEQIVVISNPHLYPLGSNFYLRDTTEADIQPKLLTGPEFGCPNHVASIPK